MDSDLLIRQRQICDKYTANFVSADENINSGFAVQTSNQTPINGLRHPLTEDTTGWYIWCGKEFSTDPAFFKPVCTRHIYDQQPKIAELLGLPPGYRFLSANDYLDVWFDPTLLNTEEAVK
jgi:hypothetical protein